MASTAVAVGAATTRSSTADSAAGEQQQQQHDSPRRSQHVSVDLSRSDGDLWAERITVCESATKDGKPKLLIRSYYRNKRTGERAWDEPPSGASQIKHATPKMRQKAEMQLQELQLTLEMIPDDVESGASRTKNAKKKKGGFFQRFRNNNNSKNKKEVHESKDLQLQKAIAQSMAMQAGAGTGDDPVVYYDPESMGQDDEDEQLAMAKALSESESMMNHHNMSEDEMLQKALEASRLDAQATGTAAAASIPPPQPDFTYDSPKAAPGSKTCKNEDMDKKMPALQFDPYSPDSK